MCFSAHVVVFTFPQKSCNQLSLTYFQSRNSLALPLSHTQHRWTVQSWTVHPPQVIHWENLSCSQICIFLLQSTLGGILPYLSYLKPLPFLAVPDAKTQFTDSLRHHLQADTQQQAVPLLRWGGSPNLYSSDNMVILQLHWPPKNIHTHILIFEVTFLELAMKNSSKVGSKIFRRKTLIEVGKVFVRVVGTCSSVPSFISSCTRSMSTPDSWTQQWKAGLQ